MSLLLFARVLGAGAGNFTQPDSATAADVATLDVTLLLSDSAAGADVAVQTAAYVRPDTSSGADVAAQTAAHARTDAASGADAGTQDVPSTDPRTTPPYQLPEAVISAWTTGTWNSTDVTRVDEDPDNPDADANYLVGATTGRVAYRFPLPAYTLDPAASVQHLRARLTNPDGTNDFDARIRLLELISSVWTPVASDTFTVPASTSGVYELPFTRAALADPTGANVAIEVELLPRALG